MALRKMVRLWVACAAALAAAGCVPGTGQSGLGGTEAGPTRGALSPVTVERDVESPDVFNLTGQGLWDGRPSLGGVWVAYTNVKDPERVIIRNSQNGQSVVGALFRRERDLPGPSLQVSSDAAEALGMLAGQPAELSVVALRREETPVPSDAEIGPEDDVADVVAAASSEPAPVEATADAGAEMTTAATPAAEPGADLAGAAAAVEPITGPKKKPGFFNFLKKKPKEEAAAAEPVATGAGTGSIEQTALDPVAAVAAAAIDRAEASAAAPQPAPVAEGSQTAVLTRAYIQVGIFSVEENANRAAEQMNAAGLTATVRAGQSNGKTYWRVIVGPAASVAERDALVSRLKGIGYPDAYPVSN